MQVPLEVVKQDGRKVTEEQARAMDQLHEICKPIFDAFAAGRTDVARILLGVKWKEPLQ